jgi:hypothetical protein
MVYGFGMWFMQLSINYYAVPVSTAIATIFGRFVLPSVFENKILYSFFP